MNMPVATNLVHPNIVKVCESNFQSDFFIIVKDSIFPIKKQILMGCGYFLKMDLRKRKVFPIKEDLDVN